MATTWVQIHNRVTGGKALVPERDVSIWRRKGFTLAGPETTAEPVGAPEAVEPVEALGKGGLAADPAKPRSEPAAEPRKNKE